jgi:hypothetical protein
MAEFPVNRRQFTLGAVASAATALLSPAEGLQQSSAKPSSPEQRVQTAMAKLSPAAQAEVEAKVAAIFRKYGSHLSEEQKTDIRRVMAETQDGLEKMRTFPLDNNDQPATVLHIEGTGGKR